MSPHLTCIFIRCCIFFVFLFSSSPGYIDFMIALDGNRAIYMLLLLYFLLCYLDI